MTRFIQTLLLILISTAGGYAKTFHLTAASETRPFSLQISCTTEGKGAFVQYTGQRGFIPLRLTRFVRSVLKHSNGQPEGYHYTWAEVFNGKVTGTYVITEQSGKVADAWYLRKKDGRRFNLVGDPKNIASERVEKYLLQGVLITFNPSGEANQFMFSYPDGHVASPRLPSHDNPDVTRAANIEDYNFDGYDDLAFSLPDAGMGVYRIFNIWLYDPADKRFKLLAEPTDTRSKCSCLCDVTVNPKEKLIYSACRGGARWWQDVYRIDKQNRLIWLRSTEMR
ncbi:hypothetical protein [Pedobacter sp. SYP-B3415]|uniref:XAC2610-related protein n=1 Tax=Pedobacter sp. SYP-B3415 TaxID=2496641 RepID=UPI00101CE010|nr:hypothetical protein [Pedobacter sp. SYP-B3415]